MNLKKIKRIIGAGASTMMLAAAIPAVASAADQQTRGNIGGYDYEMWNQNGQGQVSMNPGAGSFTCSWSNIENFLARMGKNYDSQKKNYKAFGNIVLTYDVEYTPRGNSYMCVYGWTRNPLMEYYIVEGWGDWRPPGNDGENKGTVTLNGNTYDIRKSMRYNQPSLDGTATFPQYWSVRTQSGSANNQTNYMKGTIDVSKHFEAWEKAGLDMSGTLYEVSLNIEGYRSNGSANVKSVTVTEGAGGGQQTNDWNQNNDQNQNNDWNQGNQNNDWGNFGQTNDWSSWGQNNDWNSWGQNNGGFDWNSQNQNNGWDWNNQGQQNNDWNNNNQWNQNNDWNSWGQNNDWNNQNQNNTWDWNNQNNNQWNGVVNNDWNNQSWDWNNQNNWNQNNGGFDWNNQNQNNDWNNNNQWNQNNTWDWNNQNNNQWNGVVNNDWNNNNWDWNNQNNWNQNNDWSQFSNWSGQNNGGFDWNNQGQQNNDWNSWGQNNDWNNQNQNNTWDWNNQNNNQWNGVVNNDWNNNNWDWNNQNNGGFDWNNQNNGGFDWNNQNNGGNIDWNGMAGGFNDTNNTIGTDAGNGGNATSGLNAQIRQDMPTTVPGGVEKSGQCKVEKKTYNCKFTGGQKSCNVVLPPNYNPNKQYPVMYVLHGIGGDENSMVSGMGVQELLAGLISAGKAEEMIIVLPSQYTSKNGNGGGGFGINQETCEAYDNFLYDISDSLIPYIEANYPVKTGRENRAITGFSMGGREAIYIGLMRPDLFGYVGGACPAPGITPGSDMFMTHPGCMQESEMKFRNVGPEPAVFMITGGTNDSVVGTFPKQYSDILTRNGVEHVYQSIPGGGHGADSVKPHLYTFMRYAFK
ncbi:glycoside hydrolase family 11 protein [Ruminococcus flavefaciens]|uniref:glycoside hydrolase family 11 protein n=1 Tax=Ruminococcus flavefaciens TaxID=1265 RepID=UPI0004B00EDF|nr:glycoside hydrolase family 11 protein [Ruminococcus flavefaciens]